MKLPQVLRTALGRDAQAVRRELAAIARRLAGDELEVLTLIARRLDTGRARYGALDVRRDRRDFLAEAVEELADTAVYVASYMLRMTRRGAGSADTPDAVVAESNQSTAGPLGTPTATLPRSNREELRITPTEWKGRRLCDIRVWRRRDGEWIAERRGVALRAEEVLGVVSGLGAAHAVLHGSAEHERDAGDGVPREPDGGA